jgi:hypothetical protein
MTLPIPFKEDGFGVSTSIEKFSPFLHSTASDCRRIIPLLAVWSDEMVFNTGCSLDVIFFTDGKPWKTAHPGHGATAQALVAATVGDDTNLMQWAYYNGHYGFCGAKVQHVLQADGMCYSFICPLHQHDASVLQSSSMITMLSVLFVNNDQGRPVKTVTDKAYRRTRHFRPLHTSLELRLLNINKREAAEDEDNRNKGPRMSVELSFNNIVHKFMHMDYFASHCILQQGRSNWPYLRTLCVVYPNRIDEMLYIFIWVEWNPGIQ